ISESGGLLVQVVFRVLPNASPGSYGLVLSRADFEGNELSSLEVTQNTSGSFRVLASPGVEFSGDPLSGRVPLTVQFTDLSTNFPSEWFWDFGDGTESAEQHPEHTFGQPGTYTVSLRARNVAGEDTRVRSDYIVVLPDHDPPVADFDAKPLSGDAPLTVVFRDLSAGVPDSWKWSFGDGDTSGTQHSEHTYETAGEFTVVLWVKNAGGEDELERSAYVQVSEKTDPPFAGFSGSPRMGEIPLTVLFTDLSVGDPASWFWEFGDGQTSSEQHPSHVYSRPGQFTIALTATNRGGSDTTRTEGYIQANPSPDFNGDGRIDFGDFIDLARRYGSRKGDPLYDVIYDLNVNDLIGFGDFVLFAGRYGQDGSSGVATPEVLLSDEFVDNRNNWFEGESGGYSIAIQDGVLRLQALTETGWLVSKTVAELDGQRDFRIDVSLLKREGPDQIGYGFAWGGDTESSNFRFLISGNGSYMVERRVVDEVSAVIEWTDSPLLNTEGGVNILSVQKREANLIFYIHGQEVDNRPFEAFFGSRIGFLFSDRMTLEVERIHIQLE
ncbi:MAG: PKD domain-containing protein, partial [bacterium]|nr:PKD domain-containing protein [bacterium]